MGTSNTSELGSSLGDVTHKHIFSGTTKIPNSLTIYNGDNSALQKDGGQRVHHVHVFDGITEPASSIPPATKILFIMKL